MLQLFKDENHYRVDKFMTEHGILIDNIKP